MKILITDKINPVLQKKLKAAGFFCDNYPQITYDELFRIVAPYDVLVVRSKIKVDAALINQAPHLKCIARLGAGMENIAVDYAQSKAICCLNSPEGNRDAVGEQAVGMLLMLLNNLYRANTEIRNGLWRREANRGIEIKDKTVGIVGYGNMGSAFARRLSGFGCRIIAYDKYKTGFSDGIVQEADMNELFETTNILSLHVPLTDETHYLVNNEYISKFSKPLYIINTARGKVVKTTDLVQQLQSGKIQGAALDVLEYESLSFENLFESNETPEALRYLLSSHKAVLSPHIAGWTVESEFKLADVLAGKILKNFA